MQNSPNMPEPYTRAIALGPTYFPVGLHRSLDRARHVNILCRTSTTGQLAPESPRYLVVCHHASMGLSAASNIVAQFLSRLKSQVALRRVL